MSDEDLAVTVHVGAEIFVPERPQKHRIVSFFGPCAPSKRMRSISPVRLGSVMNDIDSYEMRLIAPPSSSSRIRNFDTDFVLTLLVGNIESRRHWGEGLKAAVKVDALNFF
jgi:hypothetical protein